MTKYLTGFVALTLLIAPGAAAAQTIASMPALPDDASSDEVIVTALRIPRAKLPTQVHWSYDSAWVSRLDYEKATMFMRCAARSIRASDLRAVVDGEPNSAPAHFAQGRVIQTNSACPPSNWRAAAGWTNTPPATVDLGVSLADRIALMEIVLETFAPDAALRPEDTQQLAVRQRFQDREGVRNGFRNINDVNALTVAACLVREQPTLATRLVRAKSGTPLATGLVQTMIVQGRPCVKDVKRLTVDPVNFRYFIVDAFYRWVVAARDVDSLIPSQS